MSSPHTSSSIPHLHTLLYQYFYVFPIVFVASYVVYQRIFSPLAKVPGPILASLTRWWLVYQTRSKRYHRIAIALHERYGPVVRIAPDELSIADPHTIRQIYGAGTGFRKSEWYSVWQGTRKFDLFAGRDEKIHGQHRKMVARAYTMETLKDLEPYVDNCLEVLKGKLDEEVETRKSVDLAKWVHLFAFDVIGEVTWSTSFNFLSASRDDGTFRTILSIAYSACWLGQVPYIFHLHEMFKPLIGNWLGINKRHGGLRDFSLRETSKRRENPGGKRDIVSRFLETHEKMPEEFTFADVISMCTSNVNAGSDTTATTLRAIIYYMLKNPSAKAKLIQEIDEARKSGQLSNPPRFEEAMKLKYLQATIHEGLRMHPAVGLNLPRVVPPGGAQISGYYVPGGNVVGVNAWVVHQDKDIYGADAANFRPDRWLERDTGDMLRYFFAFGSGARACIGRNISWLEMSKLVPFLFLNYDMQLAEPEKEWTEECILFVAQKDFDVVLNPRADPATV